MINGASFIFWTSNPDSRLTSPLEIGPWDPGTGESVAPWGLGPVIEQTSVVDKQILINGELVRESKISKNFRDFSGQL